VKKGNPAGKRKIGDIQACQNSSL